VFRILIFGQILLEGGADPNLKVYSEEDGAQLRPPLAEYLASNAQPAATLVRLLLKYGARVRPLLLCTRRNPLTDRTHRYSWAITNVRTES
jgi:hypothetical protein